MGLRGARYIHIHAPCPLGWGSAPADTIRIARLAVESGLFPLFEAHDGRVTARTPLRHKVPVDEYLRLQTRFAHLFVNAASRERIALIQEIADRNVAEFGLLEQERTDDVLLGCDSRYPRRNRKNVVCAPETIVQQRTEIDDQQQSGWSTDERSRVVSPGCRAAARSDAQQGHGVHRRRARRAGPARAAAAARPDAGRAGRRGCWRTSGARRRDLEKFINLAALHDRNETLFFRIVIDHPDEMLPIIYTPTVGLACQQFGHIFQRPRGLFISANDRGRIAERPAQLAVPRRRDHRRHRRRAHPRPGRPRRQRHGHPGRQARALHGLRGRAPERSACRSSSTWAPTTRRCSRDPLYIGLQQQRLRGAAYDELVEEFIVATQEVFPGVVVQFEDFANQNAFRLLERYRDRICTFNDDIQGTAAVALAGLFSALRVTGGKLADQKILFLGAGEAATGIADLTVAAMVAAGRRTSRTRASAAGSSTRRGSSSRAAPISAQHKLPYAHEHAPVADFPSAREGARSRRRSSASRPSAARSRRRSSRRWRGSTSGRSSSRCPTRRRSRNARPSRRTEWSDGRALFACGSPFDPVTLGGRTLRAAPGQQLVHLPRRRARRDRRRARRA